MIFSKCSPAILHSEKDLKIQANNKAQASTTKPGFQICHKYLSSFSLSLSTVLAGQVILWGSSSQDLECDSDDLQGW